MPSGKAKSRTHHCPRASKGGCRKSGEGQFCTAHQTKCLDHMAIHLKTEPCKQCKEANDQAAAAKAEEAKKAAEEKKAAHAKRKEDELRKKKRQA